MLTRQKYFHLIVALLFLTLASCGLPRPAKMLGYYPEHVRTLPKSELLLIIASPRANNEYLLAQDIYKVDGNSIPPKSFLLLEPGAHSIMVRLNMEVERLVYGMVVEEGPSPYSILNFVGEPNSIYWVNMEFISNPTSRSTPGTKKFEWTWKIDKSVGKLTDPKMKRLLNSLEEEDQARR
jgi:hypothetical protein